MSDDLEDRQPEPHDRKTPGPAEPVPSCVVRGSPSAVLAARISARPPCEEGDMPNRPATGREAPGPGQRAIRSQFPYIRTTQDWPQGCLNPHVRHWTHPGPQTRRHTCPSASCEADPQREDAFIHGIIRSTRRHWARCWGSHRNKTQSSCLPGTHSRTRRKACQAPM